MTSVSQLLGALAGVTLLGSSLAAGDSPYTFVDLGTLGGPESVAMGLNDSRQVVGWSSIPDCTVNGHPCRRAFFWDQGVMIDLGVLPGDEESVARAINDAGMIVGTSESDVVGGSGTFHGFVHFGSMAPLSDLGDGQSFAHDVNEAGVIAGHARDPSVSRDRAVTWTGGAITNIGDTSPLSFNRAQGINDAGIVAGFGWNLFSPNDAIVYGGTWVTIGGIDGPFQNAEASDVNDVGQAVGLQAFPSGAWHAAVWTLGDPKAKDLGVLPGMDHGELYDINDAGQAVGRSYFLPVPFQSRAVVTVGDTLVDLNDFVPADFDGVLYEAREINEHGDIAATALTDSGFRAVLLLNDDAFTWTDEGFALDGVQGTPELAGEGVMLGGTPIGLALSNAAPNATAWLVVGTAEAQVPFKGGVLVPALNVPGFPIPFATDGTGDVSFEATWPAGLPSGLTTYYQYWIVDGAAPFGFAASNGVSATTF